MNQDQNPPKEAVKHSSTARFPDQIFSTGFSFATLFFAGYAYIKDFTFFSLFPTYNSKLIYSNLYFFNLFTNTKSLLELYYQDIPSFIEDSNANLKQRSKNMNETDQENLICSFYYKFYDTNPYLINNLIQFAKIFCYTGKDISNKSKLIFNIQENHHVKQQIETIVKKNMNSFSPIVFYSKSGISVKSNFPFSIQYRRKIQKHKKIIAGLNYKLRFAIGSINGILALFLFTKENIIAVLNDMNYAISHLGDLCGNTFYYMYFDIFSDFTQIQEEDNYYETIYCSRYNNEFIHDSIQETDKFLETFLGLVFKYRIQKNKYSFIQYIYNSIALPALFIAGCKNIDYDPYAFYATIILSYDENSKEQILDKFQDIKCKTICRTLFQSYRSFLIFARELNKFLDNFSQYQQTFTHSKDSKDFKDLKSSIINNIRSMFYFLPVSNQFISESFIIFMKELSEKNIPRLIVDNEIKHFINDCLCAAVARAGTFKRKQAARDLLYSGYPEETVTPYTAISSIKKSFQNCYYSLSSLINTLPSFFYPDYIKSSSNITFNQEYSSLVTSYYYKTSAISYL